MNWPGVAALIIATNIKNVKMSTTEPIKFLFLLLFSKLRIEFQAKC